MWKKNTWQFVAGNLEQGRRAPPRRAALRHFARAPCRTVSSPLTCAAQGIHTSGPTLSRTHPGLHALHMHMNMHTQNTPTGMFWHLLYHKHGVGTWARPVSPWRADHFWGPGKPWMPKGYAMNVRLPQLDPRPSPSPSTSPSRSHPHLHPRFHTPPFSSQRHPRSHLYPSTTTIHYQIYLKRVELPAEPITRCQRHLASRVARLKKDGMWASKRFTATSVVRASPWTPHSQSIAPSTGIALDFRRGNAATAKSRNTKSLLHGAVRGNAASRSLMAAKERRRQAAQEFQRGKAINREAKLSNAGRVVRARGKMERVASPAPAQRAAGSEEVFTS